MLALTLLVGGAAACSDDDDSADTKTEEGSDTTAADDSGDSGDSGGNAAIQEYCDAVQELVDKSAELQDDPTNSDLQAEVTELSTALGEQATELAGVVASFSAEEAEEFQACQTDFSGIGG